MHKPPPASIQMHNQHNSCSLQRVLKAGMQVGMPAWVHIDTTTQHLLTYAHTIKRNMDNIHRMHTYSIQHAPRKCCHAPQTLYKLTTPMTHADPWLMLEGGLDFTKPGLQKHATHNKGDRDRLRDLICGLIPPCFANVECVERKPEVQNCLANAVR
jgi:hypothetical protein